MNWLSDRRDHLPASYFSVLPNPGPKPSLQSLVLETMGPRRRPSTQDGPDVGRTVLRGHALPTSQNSPLVAVLRQLILSRPHPSIFLPAAQTIREEVVGRTVCQGRPSSAERERERGLESC